MKVKLNFNTGATVERIRTAADESITFMAKTALEDANEFAPKQESALIASSIIHNEPGKVKLIWSMIYARFLYYGLMMISPSTGSAWAKKGENKTKTTKELDFSKGKNPQARKLWAHYAENRYGERWLEIVRKHFKLNMGKGGK
jgi:hypothetical protein